MKTYGGNGGIASRPSGFTPEERTSSTCLVEGLVGTRALVDAVAKRKNSLSLPGIEPRSCSP